AAGDGAQTARIPARNADRVGGGVDLAVGAPRDVEVQPDARHNLAQHDRGVLEAAGGVVEADQEPLRLLAALELRLPLPSGGDVPRRFRGADDVAVTIVDGGDRHRHV